MSTPITELKDAISTVWEGATPPDRTKIRYHRTRGRSLPDGSSAERAFWFEPARRIGTDSMADSVIYARWMLVAHVFIASTGRDAEAHADACDTEQSFLLRLVDSQADGWRPTGVQTVLVEQGGAEPEAEADGAILNLLFTVLVAEALL